MYKTTYEEPNKPLITTNEGGTLSDPPDNFRSLAQAVTEPID